MNSHRRSTALIVLGCVAWSLIPSVITHAQTTQPADVSTYSGCQRVNVIATAYYSPSQTQSFYTQWSYQAETQLNGRGITTASGKPVADWVAAWPSSLPFGTIVTLDDRWSVVIQDRGWAINQTSGSQDIKIDIRAGRGELWLVRALWFGRRTFSWCVLDMSWSIQPQYHNNIWIDRSKVPIFKYIFDITLGQVRVDIGRNDPWSAITKTYLRKLWYVVSNGRLIDTMTKQTICEFQLQNNLLTDEADPLCGIIWPQTAAFMRSLIQQQWLWRNNLFEQL